MANETPLNTSPLNSWPSSLDGLPKSPDENFIAGLNATVAVEFDIRSAGTTVTQYGDIERKYVPVPGFDAVPCRIVLKQTALTEGEARPGAITTGRVLFGRAIPADHRYRLVYEDPTFGTTYLYLQGRVRSAHQMGHHWVVAVQDRAV